VALVRRRLDPEQLEQWQPRLWVFLVVLLLLVAYVIAFVVENNKEVAVHFVLATADVSLIWLILLSVAIGFVGGVLLSQFARRRARQRSGGPAEPPATD
jgi:uncharacterized integral membrane protein